MKEKKIMKGAAIDSVFLTFARFVTALSGIVIAKLLSTQFTLQEYGTYSQANLIITTVTSITILGLTDATNYFYNTAPDEETKTKYVATIFGMQYIIGILAAIVIMIVQVPIVHYFKNDDLKKVIMFVAWMPVFENILPMLQVLFVSVGQAKLIAFRNLWVSCARLAVVAVACFVTKEVRTIFAVLLVLDILQVIIFKKQLSNRGYGVNLRKFSSKIVSKILKFCIPMAVFVLVNSLNRDIDKYVIAFFTDTETLGIYSNAARLLPFDMITASVITVLAPIITRQVKAGNNRNALDTLKTFIRVCYFATWIFVVGAIVNARELMFFLYDEKYLSGLSVFVLYLFVDLIRLMGTTQVIVAKGKTTSLMLLSIITLGMNFILNICAFKVLGNVGPAIITLVITIAYTVVILNFSASILHSNFLRLFAWKELLLFSSELIILAFLALILKSLLYKLGSTVTVTLIVTYGVFCFAAFLLNYKKVMSLLRTVNKLK